MSPEIKYFDVIKEIVDLDQQTLIEIHSITKRLYPRTEGTSRIVWLIRYAKNQVLFQKYAALFHEWINKLQIKTGASITTCRTEIAAFIRLHQQQDGVKYELMQSWKIPLITAISDYMSNPDFLFEQHQYEVSVSFHINNQQTIEVLQVINRLAGLQPWSTRIQPEQMILTYEGSMFSNSNWDLPDQVQDITRIIIFVHDREYLEMPNLDAESFIIIGDRLKEIDERFLHVDDLFAFSPFLYIKSIELASK